MSDLPPQVICASISKRLVEDLSTTLDKEVLIQTIEELKKELTLKLIKECLSGYCIDVLDSIKDYVTQQTQRQGNLQQLSQRQGSREKPIAEAGQSTTTIGSATNSQSQLSPQDAEKPIAPTTDSSSSSFLSSTPVSVDSMSTLKEAKGVKRVKSSNK